MWRGGMMDNPERDADGYPSERTLDAIAVWSHEDFAGLIDFVGMIWNWTDCWRVEGKKICAVTGGWSGNEDLIGALQRNYIFWMLCWQASYRGGKFEFELP